MLRTHYRQPINWTVKALEEAEATLDRWYDAVGDAEPAGDIAPAVLDALADDLNTPAALSSSPSPSRPSSEEAADAAISRRGGLRPRMLRVARP